MRRDREPEPAAAHAPMQQLELVKETKIFDILDGRLGPRLEASGVLACGGVFYVIFDNLPHIACIGCTLSPGGWQVTGAGASYALPRDADGGILYGSAEGVSWMAPDQLVMVSDKAKPEQGRRCRAKDQSIHIFRIPAPASA
jgi:hypothetical protein